MPPPPSSRLSDCLLWLGVALLLASTGTDAGLLLGALTVGMALGRDTGGNGDETERSEEARRLVDAMPSPVLLCTDDGRVVAVSGPLRDLRGTGEPDGGGPETLNGWISPAGLLDCARETGVTDPVSGLLHRRGGAAQPVQIRVSRAPLGAGWLVGVLAEPSGGIPAVDVLVADVAGAPYLSPLLRESPLPLSITRRDDGRFVDANDACARMLHVSREALLEMTAYDVGLWPSPDERARVLGDASPPPRERTGSIVRHDRDGNSVRAWLRPFAHGGVDYLLGFALDDEGRVRAEQALASERDFTQTILDTSGQGIVVADRQDRLLYANAAFADLVGVSADALLGRPVREFIDPEHIPHYEGELARRRTGARGLYETCMVHPNGARRSVLVTAIPHPVEAVGGSVALITDLTQIKEAHAQTEAQRAFYEDIVQRLPARLVLLDRDWRFRLANRGAIPDESLRAASLGRTFEEVAEIASLPAERIAHFQRARQRLSETEQPVEWTEDVMEMGPDGVRNRRVSLLQRLEALHNADGTLLGYLGTAVDISDRVQAEQQREAQRRFYEGVLDRLPLEVIVFDPEGRFLYVAPGAMPPEARAVAFGRRYREIPGLDPERASVCEAWIARTVATGLTQTCEERRPDVGGDGEREVLHVSVPIRGGNGEIEVIAAYTLDVTERKRQEASLRAAKVQAEQLSRAKSSFLANMSHEVRTPLAGIIGFAEVLAEELSGPQHEAATLIRQSGLRLLDTLNSVLDLARLEADALALSVSPVDLVVEATAASRLFQGLTASRGVGLERDLPSAPVVVLADAAALHRVLVNLLSNATKFTTAGEVRVTVGDDAEAGPFVRIRDTGEGIDAGFLPHLFEEFRQESSGLTRAHQGSGLGLSITRRLVGLMRGRIEVESVKGEGTTFTVYLPRA